MTANADQITYWNDVAGAKWVRNQERLDRLMAPLGDALLAAAAPARGERVLDVGCGCGDLALRLAAAVGAQGAVDAVDVSRPMLARARERTGVARVRWIEADASTYAFAGEHDLLASRFGVMFFDDVGRAFSNLRRALRPSGRVAMLAWRGRAAVEWMDAPLRWLAPLLPTPAPSDGEPGPFGMADDAATCALLERVGFADVSAERLDCAITIGGDLDDAVAMLSETGPAAGAMRDSDMVLREEAGRLLREHLAERQSADGAVRLGAGCWIYRGLAA